MLNLGSICTRVVRAERVAGPAIVASLAAFPVLALIFGCGSAAAPSDALHLDAWQSQSWTADGGDAGTSPADPNATADPNGSQTAAAPANTPISTTPAVGNSVVKGDTLLRSPDTALEVAPAALDFGSDGTSQALYVRNGGAGELSYTVTSQVAWATVNPAYGASGGENDVIEVAVDRTGLAAGTYQGFLAVTAGDGHALTPSVQIRVPGSAETPPVDPPPPPIEPVLALGTTSLDFGPTDTERSFTVANAGNGTLSYTVEVTADWVTADPASGELTNNTDTITLTVHRSALATGPWAAHVLVHANNGATSTVDLAMVKPVTSPLIVPWLEMGNWPDGEAERQAKIDNLVTGLRIWRRVTDTACITTDVPFAFIYPILHETLPEMRIIPGISTHPRTVGRGFDSIEAWQLVAQDIATVAAITGESEIVLENEWALEDYLNGNYTMNWDQLRQGLEYLPQDVVIIWYPGVRVSNDPDLVARSVTLCQAVQDVIAPRLVSLSYSDPDWPVWPPSTYARQVEDEMSTRPLFPIIYLGFLGRQYWPYDEAPIALEQMSGRPDAFFYPGQTQWLDAAQGVADTLWPPGR
jgi:hypothetical protein